MKKEQLITDEIDLIDVILIVWKKKWIVAIFITFSFLLAYAIEFNRSPTSVNAKTEIKYITVFEEAKYKVYNSIISTIKPFYTLQKKYEKRYAGDGYNAQDYVLNEAYNEPGMEIEDLQIININKDFLINLFVDKLGDKSHLIGLIKKFKLLKKENYSNKFEHDEEIRKFAYSIKVEQTKQDNQNNFIIVVNNLSVDDWESFLKYLEKETNNQIQKKLADIFNNYVSYVESIKKFQLEDIETQISLVDNENEKTSLEKSKNLIIANKYSKRMQYLFDSSPISNPDNFYAAKIDYNLTEYSLNNIAKRSPIVTYVVVGIIGAILGIFFVLIANAIQNRK